MAVAVGGAAVGGSRVDKGARVEVATAGMAAVDAVVATDGAAMVEVASDAGSLAATGVTGRVALMWDAVEGLGVAPLTIPAGPDGGAG